MDLELKKKEIFKEFNKIYFEFLTFIKSHTDSKLFNKFYVKNKFMKQTNIKYFIKTWNEYITSKYYEVIINNDIEYFMNKDYSEDKQFVSDEYKNSVDIILNTLRTLYKTLPMDIINLFTSYIRNLTILSKTYFNN